MINSSYIDILPNEYKENKNLKKGEKALLGWIAENTNTVAYKTDGYFKAGYGQITKNVCIKGSNTIKRYITKLQDLGYINVECGTFGRNSGNKYTLLADIQVAQSAQSEQVEYKDVCNNTNINTNINDTKLDEIISLLKEQNAILKQIASKNVCNYTQPNEEIPTPKTIEKEQPNEEIPTPYTIPNEKDKIVQTADIEDDDTDDNENEEDDESDQQDEEEDDDDLNFSGFRKKQDRDWGETFQRAITAYKVDDRKTAGKLAAQIYEEWCGSDQEMNKRLNQEMKNYINKIYPKETEIGYTNTTIPKVENETTINSMSSMNWYKHKEYEDRVYNALKSHYNLIPLMMKGFEVMQTWRQYPSYFGGILQAARHPQGKFSQDQLKYIKNLSYKFEQMMKQCTSR